MSPTNSVKFPRSQAVDADWLFRTGAVECHWPGHQVPNSFIVQATRFRSSAKLTMPTWVCGSPPPLFFPPVWLIMMEKRRDRSPSYTKEFLRFCHTTTIRGVSRIVKAPNKSIRSLWLTFVIALFIGLLTCIILLIRQFTDYDVIHPPRVLRDTPSPFPSLTMCNLRPISPPGMAKIRKERMRDPRSFATNLNQFAAGLYFYQDKRHDYELISSAISMGGYLESLPKGSSYYLGHMRNETVIQCMVCCVYF